MKSTSSYLVLLAIALCETSSFGDSVRVNLPLTALDRPTVGWQWDPLSEDWSYLGQSGISAGWSFTVPEGEWSWSGLVSASDGAWLEGYWVMVLPTVKQEVNPLTAGLVAHYPFDGNATEVLSNGADGTLSNVTAGVDRHARAGKALAFDGDGDISIPYDADAAIGGQDFSVALWFKLDPEADSLGSTLLSLMGQPIGGLSMLNFWFTTGDAAPIPYTVGVEVWRRDLNAFVINNYPLNDDAWHHLAVVRRGREVWLYLDADLAGMNEIVSLSEPISLRGVTKLGINGFHGQMDDLRIYRRALGEEEIKLLTSALAD